MSWGAVIGTGIGLAGQVIGGGGDPGGAAEEAARREEAAGAEAIERSQEAFETSEMMLAPYAQQEYAASQQMAAQMGLPTMAAPGAGVPGAPGGYGAMRQQREQQENFDNVVRELMTMNQVLYKRSGYKGSRIHREAAQSVQRELAKMQEAGQLPQGYQMPNVSDLTSMAAEIEDSYGGHTKMAKNLYKDIKGGREGAAAFREGMGDRISQLSQTYGYQPPVAPGSRFSASA